MHYDNFGIVMDFEVKYYPLRTATGEVFAAAVWARDITERKQTERLQQELDRKLEETFTQYAQQQFLPQHASLDMGMVQLLTGTSQVRVASASLQVFHVNSAGHCTQLEPTRRPLGCRLFPPMPLTSMNCSCSRATTCI